MIPHMRYQNRYHRNRKNRLYSGAEGRRTREILFDGYKVSVQDNEKTFWKCIGIINILN